MGKKFCHHELAEAQRGLLSKYLEFGGVNNKNGWKVGDVRIHMFARLSDELVVQFIHFYSLSIVGDDVWWDRQFPQNRDLVWKEYFRNKYLDRIRYGHFMTFLGLLESYIRIIASHIDIPDKFRFSDVYKEVLKKTGHSELEEFFDFVSCLRNLIHGNGFYTQREGRSFTFRQINYEFIPGKPVAGGWFYPEVVSGIYEEILEALIKIVNSKIIKEKEFMEDDVARRFVTSTPSAPSSPNTSGDTPLPPKTPPPPQSP